MPLLTTLLETDDSVRMVPERKLRFLDCIMKIHVSFQDHAECIKYATAIIPLARELGHEDDAAFTEIMATYSKFFLNDHHLSEEEIAQMEKAANRLLSLNPNYKSIFTAIYNTALVCSETNHKDKAMEWFKKLIETAKIAENKQQGEVYLPNAYAALAMIYLDKDMTAEARNAYQNWKQTKGANTPTGKLFIMPYLCRNRETAKEAIETYEALKSFVESYPEASLNFKQFLSEAHETLGNHKLALKIFKEWAELNDSINREKLKGEGQKWAKKFELQQKEYEIAEKEKENQISWLISTILGVLAVTAVAALIWYRRTAKETRMKNRVLIQKMATIEQYRSEVSQLRLSARQRLDSKYATDKISDEELLSLMDKKTEEGLLYLKPAFAMDDMIRTLNVSLPRLQLFFRQSPDYKNLTEYLDSKRVVRACAIIRDKPGLTMMAVADNAGFRNIKAFNRKFKDFMGMTPSEYRSSYHRRAGE